jgi:peptide-methionine (S)-S-oxide reductase
MTEKATFAAGCFWGVEDIFMQTAGVTSTQVGYTGGHTQSPTYQEVCSGTTGHADAVELEFDPKAVTYEKLVRKFFELHDPTTVNRQGPDVGSQYRSAIFYHSPEQKMIAEQVKSGLARRGLSEGGFGDKPIVTEIVPATTFYRAEEYHQQYFKKNPGLLAKMCH